MAAKLFALPSALMRMENIGKVTRTQMELIGAVGMAARMTDVLTFDSHIPLPPIKTLNTKRLHLLRTGT